MAQILVVDDSAVDRKIVGGLLQQGTDWSVSYAEDGQLALESLESAKPDLIVTDLQMPNLDGLGLVRAVVKKYPSMPVMLVTSAGSEEIAIEALAVGAASYSPKRLLAADLVRTARGLLRKSSEENRRSLVKERMMECRYHFQIENDTELITPLVELFQSHMSEWDESDRLRIGVAIDEAMVNAIYHGNLEVSSDLRENGDDSFYALVKERTNQTPYSNRHVDVKMHIDRDLFSITITDQGPGYDPSRLPDPTTPENLDKVSGRGLLLIRTFMDDVNVNPTGNQIHMVKRKPTNVAS